MAVWKIVDASGAVEGGPRPDRLARRLRRYLAIALQSLSVAYTCLSYSSAEDVFSSIRKSKRYPSYNDREQGRVVPTDCLGA